MNKNPNDLLYGAGDIFEESQEHPDNILKDPDEMFRDAEDIRVEQRRGPQNNEEQTDLPDPSETITCDCGCEYDRHVGDICPSCGGNNHEQYIRKFGD